MTVIQPDLFGEFDAAEAERAALQEWYNSHHTCPCCGTAEPNGYLARQNHGLDPDGTICGFPNYGAMCVAQSLVHSHIWVDAQRGDRERLKRSSKRGRELGLDAGKIAVEARRARAERIKNMPWTKWWPRPLIVLTCCCGHAHRTHTWFMGCRDCDCNATWLELSGEFCRMWQREYRRGDA